MPRNAGKMNLRVLNFQFSGLALYILTPGRAHLQRAFRRGAPFWWIGHPPLQNTRSAPEFGQFLVCSSSTRGAPRAQPFVKVDGTCPTCPWSRRHALGSMQYWSYACGKIESNSNTTSALREWEKRWTICHFARGRFFIGRPRSSAPFLSPFHSLINPFSSLPIPVPIGPLPPFRCIHIPFLSFHSLSPPPFPSRTYI